MVCGQVGMSGQRVMFFIDDAHLMDIYSFQMMTMMLSMSGLLIFATVSSEAMANTRSSSNNKHFWLQKIQHHQAATFLELESISNADVTKIVCNELGIRETQLVPEMKKVRVEHRCRGQNSFNFKRFETLVYV